MSTNKKSEPTRRRVKEWHQQNAAHVFATFEIMVRPHLAPWPSDDDRRLITSLVKLFGQQVPPLEHRDVMGLVILRMVMEFWPPGRAIEQAVELATLQGLAVVTSAAQKEMRDAGFAIPRILHPKVDPLISEIHVKLVRDRWRHWYSATLDPNLHLRTERQIVAREVARTHCLRKAKEDQAGVASRKAKRLLDAYFKRKKLGPANLDPEDVLGEMHALGSGQIGKSRILQLAKDGLMKFDARAMRDTLRKDENATSRPGADPGEGLVADDDAKSPFELVAGAEHLARLLDSCDDIDRAIIADWEVKDTAIAPSLGISPQAVGKRRKKIIERGQKFGRARPE